MSSSQNSVCTYQVLHKYQILSTVLSLATTAPSIDGTQEALVKICVMWIQQASSKGRRCLHSGTPQGDSTYFKFHLQSVLPYHSNLPVIYKTWTVKYHFSYKKVSYPSCYYFNFHYSQDKVGLRSVQIPEDALNGSLEKMQQSSHHKRYRYSSGLREWEEGRLPAIKGCITFYSFGNLDIIGQCPESYLWSYTFFLTLGIHLILQFFINHFHLDI